MRLGIPEIIVIIIIIIVTAIIIRVKRTGGDTSRHTGKDTPAKIVSGRTTVLNRRLKKAGIIAILAGIVLLFSSISLFKWAFQSYLWAFLVMAIGLITLFLSRRHQ